LTNRIATVIEACTLDDLLTFRALPKHDGLRAEILDGELVVTPSPDWAHQQAVGGLYRALCEAVAGRGQAVCLAPFDVALSPIDVVQPDILVTASGHTPSTRDNSLAGPPELVVEVLSRSTAHRDRGRKKDRYALHGVREYWLVDPHARTVEQFELHDGAYQRVGVFTQEIAPRITPGTTIDLRGAFPD